MTSWQADDLEPGAAVRPVAGQLAAFAVDVPTDPASIASVPHGAVQGALFDPAVEPVQDTDAS